MSSVCANFDFHVRDIAYIWASIVCTSMSYQNEKYEFIGQDSGEGVFFYLNSEKAHGNIAVS